MMTKEQSGMAGHSAQILSAAASLAQEILIEIHRITVLATTEYIRCFMIPKMLQM